MKKKKKRKIKRQITKHKTTPQKKKLTLIWWVVAFLGIVSFMFFSWDTKLEERKPEIMPESISGKGVLRVPSTEYSFGTVSLKKGKVTKKIPLLNLGDGDLTISYLETSCGCTSARVINKEGTGPYFGMGSHGKNKKDWQTVIKSGEQAVLEVVFDPSVHPKFRGAATRIVSIYSDDPKKRITKINFKVKQID